MSHKDADGTANSVDPDQTAPVAKTCLSENLRSLQYSDVNLIFSGPI